MRTKNLQKFSIRTPAAAASQLRTTTTTCFFSLPTVSIDFQPDSLVPLTMTWILPGDTSRKLTPQDINTGRNHFRQSKQKDWIPNNTLFGH